eukprot:13451598-Heterocapsa_arctica.AAC.1
MSRPVPWSRAAVAPASGPAGWSGCERVEKAGSCAKPSVSSAMEIAKRKIISCSLSLAVTKQGESCGSMRGSLVPGLGLAEA